MAATIIRRGDRVRVRQDGHRVTVRTPSTTVRVVSNGGGGGIPYAGEYEFTSRYQETQTIATSGMVMAHDLTINPIPSNYGLITWDGSVLTVS